MRILVAVLLSIPMQAALLTQTSSEFTLGDGTLLNCSGDTSCSIDYRPDDAQFVNINVSAAANYGQVAVDSFSQFTLDAGGRERTTALARFDDLWTITGLAGSGFIQYNFDVESFESSENPSGGFFLYHDGNTAIQAPGFNGTSGPMQSGLIPFTFSVPFLVRGEARANVEGSSDSSGGGSAHIRGVLAGISVFDSAGQQISDYFLEKESEGGAAPLPIPEPATTALLLGGLVLLAARKRTRRARVR